MIAASFLTMKEDRMDELIQTPIDYLHVDIMDGLFVENISRDYNQIIQMLSNNTKPLDVHLMVKDVIKYIDMYKDLKPEFITFHYEAVRNHIEIINYIKSLNIKVGLAINPGTSIDAVFSYLDMVDMVLVMSVVPGKGGQEFITKTVDKVKRLNLIKNLNKFDFLIEVDGGINNITSKELSNVDILVCGNYITSSNNYLLQVESLKN